MTVGGDRVTVALSASSNVRSKRGNTFAQPAVSRVAVQHGVPVHVLDYRIDMDRCRECP